MPTFLGCIADDFTGATDQTALREKIRLLVRSICDRGLRHGSTGNTSARTADGGLPVSPTGRFFGRLDPARLSRFDASGRLVGGDHPTEDMPLQAAFCQTRGTAGAVVQLGRVKLLPFFLPGDAAMGDAVRGLSGRRSAVMLASHGPVVADKDVQAACDANEELEATARLAPLLRGTGARGLTTGQVQALVTQFDVEWDT
jgi:3-dehydro-4-phosphotetronate decarboxylase